MKSDCNCPLITAEFHSVPNVRTDSHPHRILIKDDHFICEECRFTHSSIQIKNTSGRFLFICSIMKILSAEMGSDD
jgi:hypothetical protein